MKILHITASYKPAYIYGGPIYSVAALCEGLGKSEVGSPKSEVRITIYTTLANGKEELPYPNGEIKMVDGVSVQYFKRLTKDHSHFSPALLIHLWRNANQFDIIHIHSWWNLVSMGAVLICVLRGIKPILSPRGMLGDYTFSKSKIIFHKLIGKYLLRRCTIHATTAMEAEEIAKRVFDGEAGIEDLMLEKSEKLKVKSKKLEEQIEYKKENKEQRVKTSSNGAPSPSERAGVRLRKIFVIFNIVKLPNILPPKTRIFDGTLQLIFLSRIHHKKGIELLLNALASVNFPFRLNIVGEGEMEYVESLKLKVESLKLIENIVWMGPVYGEEKFKLLADNDLFVLPSYNENFANVVIEALAVGTPVLISDKVGLWQYVKSNQFGLTHQTNAYSLAQSLIDFYTRIEEFKIHQKDFSSLPLVKRYLKMYHA